LSNTDTIVKNYYYYHHHHQHRCILLIYDKGKKNRGEQSKVYTW